MTRTWLVSSEGVEEDSSLLPDAKKIDEPRALRYWGTYPDQVFLLFRVGYDEEETNRAFRYRGRDAKPRFLETSCPEACGFLGYQLTTFGLPEPKCETGCEAVKLYQSRHDAEWEHVKPAIEWPSIGATLSGCGGRLLIVADRKVALWNGTAWERTPAPWCRVVSNVVEIPAVRLTNGASLVIADECGRERQQLFWVSRSGKPHPIDLEELAREQRLGQLEFRAPVELNHEIWVVADTNTATVLLAPIDGSQATRATP